VVIKKMLNNKIKNLGNKIFWLILREENLEIFDSQAMKKILQLLNLSLLKVEIKFLNNCINEKDLGVLRKFFLLIFNPCLMVEIIWIIFL
jgi:hypothetical protein